MQTVKGSYHNLAALADGGGPQPGHPHASHPHSGLGVSSGAAGGGMRRMPTHAATFSASSPISSPGRGPEVLESADGSGRGEVMQEAPIVADQRWV